MGKRKAENEREADRLPATIEIQPSKGDAPFAVYFPSGFDPSSTDCTWQTQAHAERKNQYAVLARTAHNVDFLGSTANAEYSTALPCRFALGVLDKRTGQLEVAPVASGRVLRMEPRARSLNYAAEGASSGKDAAAVAERRERNARLVEEFGSQRRKRQLAAAKSAQVEAGQVSAGGAVLGMIASAGANTPSKAELIRASLAQRNIPPHHPEALTADEAYRMDEIVPGSVRDALEVGKLFPAEHKPEYREELRAAGTFGAGYVLSRLPILSTPDSGEREARARCLVLLGHLLKIITRWGSVLKLKEGERVGDLAERLKMAPGVLEGVLGLFYSREGSFEGERYVLTREKRDLMLGWALVLAVRAEPQSTLEVGSFKALAEELKMKPAEVVARLRELGCTCLAVSTAGIPGGGARGSAFRVCLMPPTAEPTPFADRFPKLKMGGRKPTR